LAERTQALEQGNQPPAWNVPSDKESQSSDEEDSSSNSKSRGLSIFNSLDSFHLLMHE